MNQSTITTHAVLIGLTPLIPIPFLDDLVKSYFYRRLVRSLASRHKLSLSTDEINILAEDRSQVSIRGCLFGILEYIVKRLIRKLIIVLEWQRAIDLVTQAYYAGYLIDYAFQQGLYEPGDPQPAVRLRSAIDTARKNANVSLVRNIVKSSFNQSRALVLDAVRQVTRSLKDIAFRRRWIWRRRQKVTEEAVAEKLEQESANVRGTLGTLISNLQDYLDILMEEHQDHFERLQERLRAALQSSEAREGSGRAFK